jgi:hypothetical protein
METSPATRTTFHQMTEPRNWTIIAIKRATISAGRDHICIIFNMNPATSLEIEKHRITRLKKHAEIEKHNTARVPVLSVPTKTVISV